MEVVAAGPYLEVVHGYAEIDLGVAGKRGLLAWLHLVRSYVFEIKLLLVDGGGSQQGGLYAFLKPFGGVLAEGCFIYR